MNIEICDICFRRDKVYKQVVEVLPEIHLFMTKTVVGGVGVCQECYDQFKALVPLAEKRTGTHRHATLPVIERGTPGFVIGRDVDKKYKQYSGWLNQKAITKGIEPVGRWRKGYVFREEDVEAILENLIANKNVHPVAQKILRRRKEEPGKTRRPRKAAKGKKDQAGKSRKISPRLSNLPSVRELDDRYVTVDEIEAAFHKRRGWANWLRANGKITPIAQHKGRYLYSRDVLEELKEFYDPVNGLSLRWQESRRRNKK